MGFIGFCKWKGKGYILLDLGASIKYIFTSSLVQELANYFPLRAQ